MNTSKLLTKSIMWVALLCFVFAHKAISFASPPPEPDDSQTASQSTRPYRIITPSGNLQVIKEWRDLPEPVKLWPGDGAVYYCFRLRNGSFVHLVVVDTRSGKWQFRPAVSKRLATTSRVANAEDATAATNGAYFDLDGGESIGHIVIDGKQVPAPGSHHGRSKDPEPTELQKRIYNRSEVRFLEDAQGKLCIQFALRDQPLQDGCTLKHCLQAGPMLLPVVTSREEAFLRGRHVDSISCNGGAARTAFGTTPEGFAMMVTVVGREQDMSCPGVDLTGLSDLMRALGCSQAINLDGGASSTMFIRPAPSGAATRKMPAGRVVCAMRRQTLVKSVLLLLPTGK